MSLDLSSPYCGLMRNDLLVCGVVWRKVTMGLVCLAEGYNGTGVSGGRKDTMGLVCLTEGYDGTGVSGGRIR